LFGDMVSLPKISAYFKLNQATRLFIFNHKSFGVMVTIYQ
ncbi:MAG: hypothetical protein ACI9LY_002640, partial [Arenicella sp.]